MNSNAKLRWGDLYPELGTAPIPTDPCISPEVYEEEVAKVFSKVWLKVGRVDEIAKPGDYKVKRLDFAKTSVILMHGKDFSFNFNLFSVMNRFKSNWSHVCACN